MSLLLLLALQMPRPLAFELRERGNIFYKTKSSKVFCLRPLKPQSTRARTRKRKRILYCITDSRVSFVLSKARGGDSGNGCMYICVCMCVCVCRIFCKEDNDNSFCVCSAHMLATLVYSFELFPKAHLILIMRDNASYKMLLAPTNQPTNQPSSSPVHSLIVLFGLRHYTLPLLARLKTSQLTFLEYFRWDCTHLTKYEQQVLCVPALGASQFLISF